MLLPIAVVKAAWSSGLMLKITESEPIVQSHSRCVPADSVPPAGNVTDVAR